MSIYKLLWHWTLSVFFSMAAYVPLVVCKGPYWGLLRASKSKSLPLTDMALKQNGGSNVWIQSLIIHWFIHLLCFLWKFRWRIVTTSGKKYFLPILSHSRCNRDTLDTHTIEQKCEIDSSFSIKKKPSLKNDLILTLWQDDGFLKLKIKKKQKNIWPNDCISDFPSWICDFGLVSLRMRMNNPRIIIRYNILTWQQLAGMLEQHFISAVQRSHLSMK